MVARGRIFVLVVEEAEEEDLRLWGFGRPGGVSRSCGCRLWVGGAYLGRTAGFLVPGYT